MHFWRGRVPKTDVGSKNLPHLLRFPCLGVVQNANDILNIEGRLEVRRKLRDLRILGVPRWRLLWKILSGSF